MVEFGITGFINTIGSEHLEHLETQLSRLDSQLAVGNKNVQTRNLLFQQQIIPMIRANQEAQIMATYTEKQVQALAKERFEQETATASLERRLAVENEVLKIRQQGLPVNDMRIRQMAEERVAMQENNAFLQERRRMLFQTAFAIFAVSINIQFMLQSMARLAGADKEAAKSIKDLQSAFTLAIGPMQLMLGLTQLMTIANKTLKASIISVMKSASVVLPLIIALTTGSEALRKVMLGAALAFGIINGLLLVYKKGLIGVGLANIFVTQTEIIKKAVQSFGAFLPIIAGAIAGGLLLFGNLPKQQGQTQVGFGRRITETHQGEMLLGRPSEPRPLDSFGGGGPMTINLYLDGQKITDVVAERILNDRASGVY